MDSSRHPAADLGALRGLGVDREAEVPLGVQLAWGIRMRIGDGSLLPGQRLPGLRDLADGVGVNLNTVRSVYQRLENDGLIQTRQGSGTFVAGAAPGVSPASRIAADAAQAAIQRGISPREVAAALYVQQEEPAPELPSRDSELRQTLRDEIGALERAVTDLEVAYPDLIPARSRRREAGPRILSTQALEGVRGQLMRRLTTLQLAIDGQPSEGDPKARAAPERRRESKPAKPRKTPSAGKPRRPGRPAAEGA